MSIKFDTNMNRLGDDLARMINSAVPISLIYAEVISVSEDGLTFDVETMDDNELREIPLTGIEGRKTATLIQPTIGSLVVIGFVQNSPSMSFPVLFTQVDKVTVTFDEGDADPTQAFQADKNGFSYINNDIMLNFNGNNDGAPQVDLNVGDMKLSVTKDKFTFNGGDKPLIYIDLLTAKLKDLVNEINALKDKYNSHTHSATLTVSGSSVSGGAVSGTATGTVQITTSTADPITDFDLNDYKDDKILH